MIDVSFFSFCGSFLFFAELLALVTSLTGPPDTPLSPLSISIASQLRLTSLYLSNPVTEKILFKPIVRTLCEVVEQLRVLVRMQDEQEGEERERLEREVERLEQVVDKLEE